MKSFENKVVVITGAGSGLGRGLALQLAAAGAHLALCDLNSAGLEETRQQIGEIAGSVSLYTVDVSNRDQMRQFAEAVIARHERVELLINNAGITLTPTNFDEISDAQFEKVINVNMWGVYHGIRVFLPHLRKCPEAAIVNMSSLAGQVGLTGYAPYSMSKFAVRGLSETLQAELSETRISVLVVYPGGVKTDIIKHAPDLTAERRDAAHQAFTRTALLSVDKAAKQILDAVRKNRNELILGADAKIVLAIRALFPNRFPGILHTIFKRGMFK